MKNIILAVITMLILFACSDKNPVKNEGDENIVVTDSSVTVTVTNPEEETVIKFKDNTITIPAGAVDGGAEITVSLLSTSLIKWGLSSPGIKIESTEPITDSITVECPDLDVSIPTTALVRYGETTYSVQTATKELGYVRFTFLPVPDGTLDKASKWDVMKIFIFSPHDLWQDRELIGDVNVNPGEKVLVLIHGITANTEKWTTTTLTGKTFYEEMQEIYNDRILMYQYPSGIGLDENISELYSLLNGKIGEDIQIDIIGHSMGGVLGRKFNLLYPEKVDKFISLGSPFNGALVEYDETGAVFHISDIVLVGTALKWFVASPTQGAQDITLNSPFVNELNTIGGTTSCEYLNIIGTKGRESWVPNDSIVFVRSADMLDPEFPYTRESPASLMSEKFFLTHTKLPLGGDSLFVLIKEFLNDEAEYGTMTDIDGNVYKTVKIGNQWWMAENLKVTRYRNGDAIPRVAGSGGGVDWGTYRYYDDNLYNSTIYGLLYNWYAVNDDRGLAPLGWHVSTDEEWEQLVDYLDSNAGGKMKEEGTTHWKYPNTGATNESGFTGLPGGAADASGDYWYIKEAGFWWTSSTYVEGSLVPSYAWGWSLGHDYSYSGKCASSFAQSRSIRCVKN